MNWPPPLRFMIPLVLLVFAGTAGLIVERYGREIEFRRIEEYARQRANVRGTQLATMSSYIIENGPAFGVQRELAMAGVDRDLQTALVFGENNRVLFSGRYDLQNQPIEKTPANGQLPLIQRAREKHAGELGFSPNRHSLYGAFPFPIVRRVVGVLKESEVGVVFVEFDLSQAKAMAAAANARHRWLASGVLLGLCVVVSLLFGPMLTLRVRRLSRTARQLASGDLSARSALRGGDELAELSRTFDQMAADLQRRNADVRETEARFRFLVEGIAQVFWLMEIEPERFLYVGPSFEHIWQRPVAELMADSDVWISTVHPDDRTRASAAFLAWITGRADDYDEIYRILRPDGSERWIRDRGVRFDPSVEGRKRIAGIAEDVTSQHLRKTEQDELERKLRETQKLESLGVLAGGIAHDFNNLLAGILGNAILAREEIAPANPVHPYLEHIESAAMRAAELCKQMLAYSGKGRFQVQRIDLSELVRDTTNLVQLSIDKTAVLRFNLAENLPPIEVDPTQIRQVIMNLVINASEAIGGRSGVICLNTGTVQVDSEYLEKAVLSPTLPEGTYVFLEVSDDGSGMSAETQARIFEPFFTTKFAGRGLGLSAVLGIVRGHRGAMRVYSEEGKGTTFKLLFPSADGEAEPIETDQSVAGWTSTGSVLVVDDDENVRTVSARIVEKLGFTPLVAKDGRDGVEKFRQHRDEIVAVLMDLTMPHLDGEQAFRELRVLDPRVRVILMSGFNEQDAVNRFAGKGLAGFLQKPFRPDALRRKLKEIVEAAG